MESEPRPEIAAPKNSESPMPLISPRQQKRPRVAEENRRRATKACNECRRLKEKCEGGFPCARCTRTRQTCKFNQAVPPQRPLVGNSEDDERTRLLEQIARHFLGDVSLGLPSLRRISERIESRPLSVDREATEIDLNDLEDLKLEDETFTVKGLSQNTAHYSGEFSHWNFSQRLRRRIDEYLDQGVGEDAKWKTGVTEYWRATQLQTPASNVFAVLNCLPPPHVVEFLIKTYFQYAQTNSFYVEESWLRAKLGVLNESPGNVSSSDAGWVCSVFMVLAIGSQFAHVAATSLDTNDINDEATDGVNTPEDQEVGVALYHMASKLIPDVITIASLESVQACLLLAHYALPLDTHGLAYTYLGLAIKMAIQNGMHRKYTGHYFDAHTVESRNRLWWTAYTLEKRICVLHGRPLSISPNDVDADLPVDVPEFRTPNKVSTFGNMTALIYLTIRLGDISYAISLLRKCPKRLQSTYFEHIFEIRQQLRTWWESLPSSVTCRDISPSLQLFRHNIHLTLCFRLNEIYMGRPFIFSDSKALTPGKDAMLSAQSPVSRTHRRRLLVSDAVNAAVEIIKLAHLLQENCGLARASYTEFSSCRAALLVILAQSLNEQSDLLQNSLANGMKLIKGMAIGIVSAKSEVSMIESLELAIKRLDQQGNQRIEGQDKESGYDRFKSWAMLWKNEQTPTRAHVEISEPIQASSSSAQEILETGFDTDPWGSPLDMPAALGESMVGYGFDDMLNPLSPQGMGGEMLDEQWQNGFANLDGYGMGFKPGGWG